MSCNSLQDEAQERVRGDNFDLLIFFVLQGDRALLEKSQCCATEAKLLEHLLSNCRPPSISACESVHFEVKESTTKKKKKKTVLGTNTVM